MRRVRTKVFVARTQIAFQVHALTDSARVKVWTAHVTHCRDLAPNVKFIKVYFANQTSTSACLILAKLAHRTISVHIRLRCLHKATVRFRKVHTSLVLQR